jgi:hypothetical protein
LHNSPGFAAAVRVGYKILAVCKATRFVELVPAAVAQLVSAMVTPVAAVPPEAKLVALTRKKNFFGACPIVAATAILFVDWYGDCPYCPEYCAPVSKGLFAQHDAVEMMG